MKNSRIQEMSIEVVVGAFLFAILLALATFTIILSRENLFRPTFNMDIRFDEVMGIREGDNVFHRGVIVGKIRRIDVEDSGVSVRAALDRPIQLRTDYVIEILPASVLGGRYLQINRGSDDGPLLPEDATIVGRTPLDLVDQATRTVLAFREELEGEDGILARVGAAMGNVQELTDRLARGEGTIGRLLTDDTIYDNLEAISADLRTVSARLTGGEGLIGKLLSDDDTVYADMQATLQSLRRVAESIDQGEGTIGRLVRDPELYEDVRLLIHELRATIDDFRETAPITTFTSIFFGAF